MNKKWALLFAGILGCNEPCTLEHCAERIQISLSGGKNSYSVDLLIGDLSLRAECPASFMTVQPSKVQISCNHSGVTLFDMQTPPPQKIMLRIDAGPYEEIALARATEDASPSACEPCVVWRGAAAAK